MKILVHVFYEIEQLFRLCKMNEQASPRVPLEVGEATLLHVRVLFDFFVKKKRRKDRAGNEMDDVLSEDFGFPAQNVQLPREWVERLNKDLAHLTYSRLERNEQTKEWTYDMVVAPVVLWCLEFLEFLGNRTPYCTVPSIRERVSALLQEGNAVVKGHWLSFGS